MPCYAKKKILLVEDDPLIAIAEKTQLERCGYAVETAGDGPRALAAFAADPGIDLVLMDMDLGPGPDGTEIAAGILAQRDVPVVFCSSHIEPELVERTERIASYGYAVKSSGIAVIDASIKMAFKLFDAKRAIAESELKHRAMIAGSSDVIAVVGPDGVLSYTSPNAERIYGWPPEAFAGADFASFAVEDDRERLRAFLSALSAEVGSSREIELRFLKSDGGVRDVALTGTRQAGTSAIRGTILNFHDVSPCKLAERRLMENKAFMDAALHSMSDVVFIADAEGSLVEYNNAFIGFHRFRGPEDTRLHLADFPEHFEVTLLDGSPVPLAQWAVPRALGGETASGVEYLLRRKDSGEVWIGSYSFGPIRDPDGAIIGAVVVGRDVSAQKDAERRVQDLLKEKDLILREVHHRMKNFMNGMKGALLMEADNLSDPAAIEALEKSGRRLHSMELLYEKMHRAAEFTELPAGDYLGSLVEEVLGYFPKSRNLRLSMDFADLVLSGKKLQTLGLIVNELVSNAMKHAFAGREAGSLRVSLSVAGELVSLVVADDGVGLGGSGAPKEGSGFGLRLAESLAVQAGGTLRLESRNGTIATVEFKR